MQTHLRGGKAVLHSKTPELIEQEFYGLLLAHRAVRTLMLKAARKAELNPDRLAFTHAVRGVRRKLAAQPALRSLSNAPPALTRYWPKFSRNAV